MNRNTDRAFKPLYQLNNKKKELKIFGKRKKESMFCLPKIHNFVLLHTYLTNFLFKFISLAYECIFVSANHIIYDIGYFLNKLVKNCSHLVEIFYF